MTLEAQASDILFDSRGDAGEWLLTRDPAVQANEQTDRDEQTGRMWNATRTRPRNSTATVPIGGPACALAIQVVALFALPLVPTCPDGMTRAACRAAADHLT